MRLKKIMLTAATATTTMLAATALSITPAHANYPQPPRLMSSDAAGIAADIAPSSCATTAPAGTVIAGVNVKTLCERAVAAATTYEAEAAIKFAFSKLGTPYSQDPDLRATTMFDCSSFVGRAYNASGGKVRLPSGNLTSFFPYFGWTGAYVPSAYTGTNVTRIANLADLRPGDIIILFDGADPSQSYGNNGHAVMYLGDSKVIQAGQAPDGESKVSVVNTGLQGFSNAWMFRYNTLGKPKTTTPAPTPQPLAPGSTATIPTGTISGAIFGNVTIVNPVQSGYFTIYPCDQPRPLASAGNYLAGETRATFAAAKTDPNGNVCVYTSGGGHIVFDKSTATNVLAIHAPSRKLDTRTIWGPALYKIAPYELVRINTGVANKTAVGTLTITSADAPGTAAIFPCAEDPGNQLKTSNVNYTPGRSTANLAAAKADANGLICVKVTTRAQIVWDQVSETITLPGASPIRQFDSRTPAFFGGVRVPDTGQPNFLSGAVNSAVLVNITVTDATGPGWVAIYPCSQGGPSGTSSINYTSGKTIANAALVQTGSDGRVCFKLSGNPAHVIVDKMGAATMWAAQTPTRIFDTRTP